LTTGSVLGLWLFRAVW